MSNFVYRKNDTWEALSIALILILFNNPFLITDIGLQFSFFATIGIIIFQKTLKKWINIRLDKANRKAIKKNKRIIRNLIKILKSQIGELCIDSTIVTISATLAIIPIIILNFNNIAITSLFISILASFILGPIIIFIIIYIFFRVSIIEKILNLLLEILVFLSKMGNNLPLNQIYLITPNILEIIIYYIFVFNINFIISINLEKNPSQFKQRIKNIISLLKYKIKLINKKIIPIMLIICILIIFSYWIPSKLKIYFIDVKQGDCTLVVTPRNKSILIDGGGSELSNFDVGKNILMPYLLDRKIFIIDYIFFSHLDLDHCQGLFYILENMKVRNVIIGKQYEKSSNYEKFIQLTKNVNVKVVQSGDVIDIEKDLKFNILWPNSNNMISKNAINNNSMVCKLVYKNFSMMFTGDIEEIAEEAILDMYKNNLELLKSNCLKIAHHGSKTSSSNEFLEKVQPQIALIGVGENNRFGHPNKETLEKLFERNIKVYRTDEMGEIIIKSNGKSMKIEKFKK